MKIIRKISFILFVCFLIWTPALADELPTGGMTCVPTSVDLGVMKKGDKKEVEITVTNVANIPVMVTAVRHSCRCIRVRLPEKPLKPGEAGVVVIAYHAKDPGAFYKEVELIAGTGSCVVRVKGLVEGK